MSFQILFRFGLVAVLSCILAPVSFGASADSFSTPSSSPLQVRFIQFEGIRAFSANDLKKILTTKEKRFHWFTKAPLEETVFDEDLETLEKYYQSQGFYHARILSHKIIPLVGKEVRIEIQIEEGPPMKVSEISLTVNGESSGPWHKELLAQLPMHTGERFKIPDYQDIEKAALRYLADWGYPKAHVDMKARLDKRTNRASVFVDVKMGTICFFGPITLEGNDHVADHVILRELTFTPGERFSASRIQESQQRLFGLDLFQFADLTVENMEGAGTILPVRVLVKEAKKQTVRVGAGYGTEDEFRGQVQWEIRDFLGDGRRLQVNTKASSLVQLLEGRFFQPYLFLGPSSSLTVDSGVKHEDQESFENRKFYLTPLINYKWTEKMTLHFGYDLEANRLLNVKVQPAVQGPADQEHQEFFVSSLLGGASWEQVDSTINPHKGFRFLPNFEWASGAFGSTVDFIKLTLEGRGYLPMEKYGVLAAKLKWGSIETLENTVDIPIFKRFFAGGSDSVRGYPYQRLGLLDKDGNPIGGMTLVEGSLEWRFPIRKSFEGVVFFDFGNVFEKSFDIIWNDLGYAAGCGIRYLTLVGPLRLDFGYQLNPPKQDFFNPYQIHFSIGQAF